MTTFRVWAPRADAVEVSLTDRRIPLAPDGDRGWWAVDVDGVGPGTDYGFCLDGADPLPDPRSAWQPHGVHGPSRLVDQAAFAWTDADWTGFDLTRAVLYELHVGTFSRLGTFDGVIDHLDHLVELGIDAVELMPVAEFPGDRNWGYDGVDLFAPHHDYGGPDGLKRLVDACHRRGLGVVLDVVYNHFGPEGGYLSRFGPYLTDFYATPWGEAVNYDRAGSDEVRRFVIDSAVHWLRDHHVDGLRLDAIHAIVDTSATHLLEALASEVNRLEAELGRRLWLIAESDLDDPRIIAGPEVGGFGIDAQWSDDFHHALHSVVTGETTGYYRDFGTIADLGEALEHAWVHAGSYSPFRDRVHGRPHGGMPSWKFVVCAQNHDQVGNRALGDRMAAMVDPDRLEVAAALYLLSPFTPLVFQGEEWAAGTPFQYFTSHTDPELAQAVSEGRRREFASFGWDPGNVPDPQNPTTFERSRLDWSEPDLAAHARMLGWYRRCISLRPTLSALRSGSVRVDVDETARTLRLVDGEITLLVNLGDRAADLGIAGRPDRVLLSSFEMSLEQGAGDLRLPPSAVVVLGP